MGTDATRHIFENIWNYPEKWSQEPNSKEEGKGEKLCRIGLLYTQGGKSPPELGRVLVDSLGHKILASRE